MKTLSTLCCIFLASFAFSQEFASDYRALSVPHHYSGEVYYLQSDSTICEADVDTLKHNASLLGSFGNLVSNVTIYELTAEGGLKITGLDASTKNEVYEVIYDFAQSQTYDRIVLTALSREDEAALDQAVESVIVGVSVRMVAKIKTLKAGINLSSPFSLIANIDKIQGSLEVRLIGIGSQKINSLVPTTTDLSPASITICLQAVATIKSHIYDNETVITPQVLAYAYKKEVSEETSGKGGKKKNKIAAQTSGGAKTGGTIE